MERLLERKKEKRKCASITLITIEVLLIITISMINSLIIAKVWRETEAWNKNTNAMPSALRQKGSLACELLVR
jgi:hypothetical protein